MYYHCVFLSVNSAFIYIMVYSNAAHTFVTIKTSYFTYVKANG